MPAAMPALHDLAALAAQIAAFTGGEAMLDPRLQLAACAAPVVAWSAPGNAAVEVRCSDPAWRIFVGVRTHARAPLVRRGDTVTVTADGDGFRVTIAAIADNDAAAGERVRLHSGATRLTAQVQPDGSVLLTRFNFADDRR